EATPEEHPRRHPRRGSEPPASPGDDTAGPPAFDQDKRAARAGHRKPGSRGARRRRGKRRVVRGAPSNFTDPTPARARTERFSRPQPARTPKHPPPPPNP